jgi:iron-sulfur cluster repair protein YtfE (RIC family)
MNYVELSPAQIVKHDIRAAAVFERYGVDFCCKGKHPLLHAIPSKPHTQN